MDVTVGSCCSSGAEGLTDYFRMSPCVTTARWRKLLLFFFSNTSLPPSAAAPARSDRCLPLFFPLCELVPLVNSFLLLFKGHWRLVLPTPTGGGRGGFALPCVCELLPPPASRPRWGGGGSVGKGFMASPGNFRQGCCSCTLCGPCALLYTSLWVLLCGGAWRWRRRLDTLFSF